MSNETETTGALAKAIKRNHRKAGITDIKGDNPLERQLNKNRIARGLEQKDPGFKSQNEEAE